MNDKTSIWESINKTGKTAAEAAWPEEMTGTEIENRAETGKLRYNEWNELVNSQTPEIRHLAEG